MYVPDDATVFSYDASIARAFSDVLVPLGYHPIGLLIPPRRIYLNPTPSMLLPPTDRALEIISRDLYRLIREPSSLYVIQLDFLDFQTIFDIVSPQVQKETSRFYGYSPDPTLIEKIRREHDFIVHDTWELMGIFRFMKRHEN